MGPQAIKTAAAAALACAFLQAHASTTGAAAGDTALVAAAKCVHQGKLSPPLLSYSLLLSSTTVINERKAPITLFVGAVPPSSNVKVWGLKPSRLFVAERDGQPNALVGSFFSKDYPMSFDAIVGSYQGGFKRRVELVAFPSNALSSIGVASARISKDPVHMDRHLFAATTSGGETFITCGTRAELTAFAR